MFRIVKKMLKQTKGANHDITLKQHKLNILINSNIVVNSKRERTLYSAATALENANFVQTEILLQYIQIASPTIKESR